jgi:hypothetical protein
MEQAINAAWGSPGHIFFQNIGSKEKVYAFSLKR